MKWKRVMALIGSVSIMMGGCEGPPIAYADEIAAEVQTETVTEACEEDADTEAANETQAGEQEETAEASGAKEEAHAATEAQETTEAQEEVQAETAATEVTETVAETMAEETQPETVADTITEVVAETAAETPTEVMEEVTEAPAETIAEAPEETAAETVTEAPTETVAETTTESPAEPVAEAPTEDAETDTDTSSDTVAEAVAEPTTETPSENLTEAITEAPSEKETEAATEVLKEAPPEEVTEYQTEAISETDAEGVSEGSTEEETEEISEATTDETSEAATEESTEDITEDQTESDTYESGDYSGSYSSSGSYYWDESWYINSGFRFTQIDKEYVLIGADGTFVYEEPAESARRIGELPYGGVAMILKREDDDWLYVESGDIRGFVPESAVTEGEMAEQVVKTVGEEALTQGETFCEKADNEAFTYTKTTSYEVLAEKDYGMSLTSTWIYEYPDASSRHVGDVSSGSLVYVLVDCAGGWYYVESGDVRGFMPGSALLSGQSAAQLVDDLGEENASLAEELVEPEENRSLYYSLLSVETAETEVGEDISRTAESFVGNLVYVYGGTSLSSGADCSGFIQSLYAEYGINLPRTAEEQGLNGQKIDSLEEAQPGDIIYYESGPHVGIYIGNGKVVQCSGRSTNTASNPGQGPTVSDADYMPITSIRRYLIVTDEDSSDGGCRTDETEYSQEQLEVIWAVVAQEDNGSYEGALAVISSAMNRTESEAWSYAGNNAYEQLTAAGQYCYSIDDYWRSWLGGNVPDYVKQAVSDCLNRGIRNHSYTCFRSGSGGDGNRVQIGGNWYFGS